MAIKDIALVWTILVAVNFQSGCCLVQEKPGYCWTPWINRYKANEGTDLEMFTRLAALENNICFRPFAIDYARTDGKPVKEKLDCNFFGCVCRDAEQDPGIFCDDYKVRFLCPCKRNQESFVHSDDLFVCNEGETQPISCPGQSILQVTSAYYGNIWFSRCGLGSFTSSCRQESSQTLEKLSVLCNGKNSCEIKPHSGDIEDRYCKNTKKILHIEYSCEAVARAPGNYIGSPGEIYIDSSCKYKCTFLMTNRAICLPVCPIYYGFACAPGSVIRWTMKPDTFAKQCQCRQPVCIQPGKSCKVNNKIYQIGEVFELGCQEECICLGNNNLKCAPLCPTKPQKCQNGLNDVPTATKKTKFAHCSCIIPKCL